MPRAEEFGRQARSEELAVIGAGVQKGCCRSKAQKDADPGEVRVRWLDPSLLPKAVVAEDDGPKRRLARLNKEDFYKFGFTDPCLGYQAMMQGGVTRPHTEHCRRDGRTR